MAGPAGPDPSVSFSNEEILRYSRHLIMPEVALGGQAKLKAARVLCIGAGGLGSPIGVYLAAAGVGTIGVVDFDVVDATNLQRQIIHTTADVGRSKVVSASEKLSAINPNVRVIPFDVRLSSENARELFSDFDIIIDGTDNFATRYLVNDACVLTGKPYVYASVFRFEGQATIFAAPGGPCYRCLYPEPPPPGMVPSCAEGGVLGVLPGMLGLIQATEAIKLILGSGDALIGRLLLVDALGMRFREVHIARDGTCPVCGDHPTQLELIDYEEFCGIRGEETESDLAVPTIQPEDLKAEIDRGANVLLLDVREPHEHAICCLGEMLIPLGELPARLHELDSARDIVTYCKSGARSAQAAAFLRDIGFRRVRNLAGGINAWSARVDPTLPRY